MFIDFLSKKRPPWLLPQGKDIAGSFARTTFCTFNGIYFLSATYIASQ